MDNEAGVLGQPGFGGPSDVTATVVHHEMNLEFCGNGGLDLLEEPDERSSVVAGGVGGPHLTGMHVEGGHHPNFGRDPTARHSLGRHRHHPAAAHHPLGDVCARARRSNSMALLLRQSSSLNCSVERILPVRKPASTPLDGTST